MSADINFERSLLKGSFKINVRMSGTFFKIFRPTLPENVRPAIYVHKINVRNHTLKLERTADILVTYSFQAVKVACGRSCTTNRIGGALYFANVRVTGHAVCFLE